MTRKYFLMTSIFLCFFVNGEIFAGKHKKKEKITELIQTTELSTKSKSAPTFTEAEKKPSVMGIEDEDFLKEDTQEAKRPKKIKKVKEKKAQSDNQLNQKHDQKHTSKENVFDEKHDQHKKGLKKVVSEVVIDTVSSVISHLPIPGFREKDNDNASIQPKVSELFKNKVFKVQPCSNDCHKKVFILSLDGGGIRGVIEARILMYLTQLMNKSLVDLFDLFAGTSTGGLIALGAALPDEMDPSKAKLSSEDLLEMYKTEKEKIFKKKFFIHLGLFESKYKTEGIENFCKTRFTEKMRLSQLLVPTVVVAFDDTNNQPVYFSSHGAFLGDSRNKYLWKAGRITSAAPYYFAQVNEDGVIYSDGGLTANNPAWVAYQEARKLFPNKKPSDFIVLSIGTGIDINNKPTENKGLKDVREIIKAFEDGQIAQVDYNLNKEIGTNYIRLQTKLDFPAKTDQIDDNYIEDLIGAAEKTLTENAEIIEYLQSLWIGQQDRSGNIKHQSSYDEWRRIQNLMHNDNTEIDLNNIQEQLIKECERLNFALPGSQLLGSDLLAFSIEAFQDALAMNA